MLYRYSRWDGSQNVPDLDADQVLDEMAEDLVGVEVGDALGPVPARVAVEHGVRLSLLSGVATLAGESREW